MCYFIDASHFVSGSNSCEHKNGSSVADKWTKYSETIYCCDVIWKKCSVSV